MATVPVSLPPLDPPFLPAAELVSSLEKGGGAPGSRALDGSDVVVVDLRTVELVANARVVAVVLLVAALVVVVVDDLTVPVVDEAGPVVLLEALPPVTTTTPVIPAWILHR
jgi:hypothetical protein